MVISHMENAKLKLTDLESGNNSSSDVSKRNRNVSTEGRRAVRRKQQTPNAIPITVDVYTVSSSVSLSVNKIQDLSNDKLTVNHEVYNIDDEDKQCPRELTCSDPIYRSMIQYMDSSISAVRKEIQTLSATVNAQSSSVVEMKNVLMRSLTPISKDSQFSPQGEDIKAYHIDANSPHVGRKLFDPAVVWNDDKFRSPTQQGHGVFSTLMIPVTFEIPKGMSLNDEEIAVATYLYSVDGSVQEAIVKSLVIYGYRNSFDTIKPGGWIDSDVLTMVSCMLTFEERARISGQKMWFLGPCISQMALSWTTSPKTIVANYKSRFMSRTDKLLKIYIPINDSNRHWYLLCVDLVKHQLICLDSKIDTNRKAFRERQIRQMAIFLECVIEEKSLFDILEPQSPRIGNPEKKLHRVGEFRIVYPRNLPQQNNEVDCGVWVARWQMFADLKSSAKIDPVDDKARMRLALDLVLKNYNQARENVIRSSRRFVQEKQCQQQLQADTI